MAIRERRRALAKSLIAATLLTVALSVSALQPSKRVLVLHSFGPAFGDVIAKPLRDELDRQLPGRVDLYESWLASARFATTDEDPAFANYIRALFADRPPDLIVTFGAPAANFLQRYRKSMFPSVPALFADVEERRVPPAGFTGNDTAVAIAVSFPAVVENILRVLPATSHLAIVIGNSPIERYWVGEIQRSLQPFAGRLNLIWLNQMPFDEVLNRAASLPPRSAIFYVLLSSEVAGIPADEDRALAKLHAAANAPLFSYTDAYLGKGIVGGPLVSSQEVARRTVNLAVRILGGQRASSLRTAPVGMTEPRFDMRELERWKISEAGLPAGSTILFRQPPAWERYRWEIAVASFLLLFEALLVVSLLYERHRRQVAEIETREEFAELAHMNRRATVGELSGAIAHELNQPLGAILRNSEAAELLLDAPSPDIRELKDIVRDIKHDDERAGEVIRRLRLLLAKVPLEPQEFDVKAMLSEVFEFLSTQASARRITLITRMPAQAPCVHGDRVQLQQVILNLVMNAMEAMGTDRQRQREIIGRIVLTDDGFAEVSVEDFGPGIPADKAKQIFEPFYTTKAAGMGMGLSIARTIIKSHGGRIWAENKKAGGAVFRFTLPPAKHHAHEVALQAEEPDRESARFAEDRAPALKSINAPSTF